MAQHRPTGDPLRILLVEDDPAHANLVVTGLERHRIANRIIHVRDGEQALDYLFRRGDYADEETSPRPNLILLDLRLPKIDGLEVLKEVKESEELSPIPVVVLTTSAAERDVSAAYENKANSYLVKPIGFREFSELLNDLGFFWLAWNRQPWPEGGAGEEGS